ncbi:MAG: beta-ketoacyl-[acyl-carrier-protein] synthase family protein [Polyangiaceae bacterium]|nr:beta-ketoacyl-[acyl-carrier-protein] synthase family protein [Polyangiaceae bacterium]
MTVRLWVTGVGLVTSLGWGVEATWKRLVRGDCAFAPVTLFEGSAQRAALVAEVAGVTVPGLPAGAWSRTSAMALAAVDEALAWARLEVRERRVGLVVGTTTGGMLETERLLAALHAEPHRRMVTVDMLSHPLTSTGDLLDERIGPFTRVRTLSSACSGGANALVVAAGWLLSGEVDAVVAGGADGLCRLTLTGFNALSAIDPEGCRPFDRRRRGTTLGEGAGFLVLERAPDARRRGASPVAELAGWALGSEAHHITNPEPAGTVVGALFGRALARAGLQATDVDYVNAHGTGTPANDAMEAAALRIGLGAELPRIPISSSKGQIGHTLGAAGGIEAAVTALVVARHALVPTAGLDEPDPALPLHHVAHVGRRVDRVRAALSNAFGFGGMATVLAFTEPELVAAPHPLRAQSLAAGRAVVTGASVFCPRGSLGPDECAELPCSPPAASASQVEADADAFLDPARARRLDRMARLGTVAVTAALRGAGVAPEQAGVVLGNAFANVDECAAFMHRVFEKGPRAASPAVFPNLVPSSPVGHVSIYTSTRGPSFATADLDVSGPSAVAQAAQLVGAGEASCIVAGASEPRSDIVDRVLSSLFGQAHSASAVRGDLAAALVVEGEDAAAERGARPLARVAQVVEWRESWDAAAAALDAPRSARVEVVVARPSAAIEALVERTAWRSAPQVSVAEALGESYALTAAALATAAARVGTGRVDEALVVAMSRRRGFAFILVAA